MQIQTLVIYGHNGEKRELRFNIGGVSIIAGDSATGKSSLIEIVDYCLGSGECRVPDGVIRERVAWYALELISQKRVELFVARCAPDDGKKSSQKFFLVQGKSLDIPRSPDWTPTHNRDGAIEELSRFLGMAPNQTFGEGPDDDGYSITVRHAVKFCLQYQDEIASKRSLFHQQGESFKARAIYDSLPYLLGFQDRNYLQRLDQLRFARNELKRARRRVAEYQSIKVGGFDLGSALVAEARHAAILQDTEMPSTTEALRRDLREVLSWAPNRPAGTKGLGDALSEAQTMLVTFEKRRRDIKEMVDAAESVSTLLTVAESEWQEQAARLKSVKIIPPSTGDETVCPLCEQPTIGTAAELPKLDSIRRQFDQMNRQLEGLEANVPAAEKYIRNLKDELDEVDSNIATQRATIRKIRREAEENAAVYDLSLRQAKIVGRVEQYLAGADDTLGELETLQRQLSTAERRVTELESQVNVLDVKQQLRSISDRLQPAMTKWASELKLEFAGDPFRIDFEHLTVEASRKGYHLPLYRMGSGKNWLGCHLIAHLALHTYFVENASPVPRFLFFDQPTQVFYPPEEIDKAKGDVDGIEFRRELRSEDKDIVERMFRWIIRQTEQINALGGFQVVITDHAQLRLQEFQEAQIDLPRWQEGQNCLVPGSWKPRSY